MTSETSALLSLDLQDSSGDYTVSLPVQVSEKNESGLLGISSEVTYLQATSETDEHLPDSAFALSSLLDLTQERSNNLPETAPYSASVDFTSSASRNSWISSSRASFRPQSLRFTRDQVSSSSSLVYSSSLEQSEETKPDTVHSNLATENSGQVNSAQPTLRRNTIKSVKTQSQPSWSVQQLTTGLSSFKTVHKLYEKQFELISRLVSEGRIQLEKDANQILIEEDPEFQWTCKYSAPFSKFSKPCIPRHNFSPSAPIKLPGQGREQEQKQQSNSSNTSASSINSQRTKFPQRHSNPSSISEKMSLTSHNQLLRISEELLKVRATIINYRHREYEYFDLSAFSSTDSEFSQLLHNASDRVEQFAILQTAIARKISTVLHLPLETISSSISCSFPCPDDNQHKPQTIDATACDEQSHQETVSLYPLACSNRSDSEVSAALESLIKHSLSLLQQQEKLKNLFLQLAIDASHLSCTLKEWLSVLSDSGSSSKASSALTRATSIQSQTDSFLEKSNLLESSREIAVIWQGQIIQLQAIVEKDMKNIINVFHLHSLQSSLSPCSNHLTENENADAIHDHHHHAHFPSHPPSLLPKSTSSSYSEETKNQLQQSSHDPMLKHFLESRGLGDYNVKFSQRHIDFTHFSLLDAFDLNHFGCFSSSDCATLYHHIEQIPKFLFSPRSAFRLGPFYGKFHRFSKISLESLVDISSRVAKEAWIMKRKNRITKWRARYTRLLSNYEIYYYSSEKSEQFLRPCGSIELSSVESIVPQKYDGDTHRFAFQVVSKERGWEFAFSSVDLRDEWLKLLVDLVIFVRGGGGGDSSNLAAVQLDHLS